MMDAGPTSEIESLHKFPLLNLQMILKKEVILISSGNELL